LKLSSSVVFTNDTRINKYDTKENTREENVSSLHVKGDWHLFYSFVFFDELKGKGFGKREESNVVRQV
jgi:hypothetical protein